MGNTTEEGNGCVSEVIDSNDEITWPFERPYEHPAIVRIGDSWVDTIQQQREIERWARGRDWVNSTYGHITLKD
jgi:hypothetical protein